MKLKFWRRFAEWGRARNALQEATDEHDKVCRAYDAAVVGDQRLTPLAKLKQNAWSNLRRAERACDEHAQLALVQLALDLGLDPDALGHADVAIEEKLMTMLKEN